jgi:hypothetical protein
MSRMFLKVFSFISTMKSPARVAALIRCRCRMYAQDHRSQNKFLVIPIHFTGPSLFTKIFKVVILLTWRYVAILPSINKGSIHHIHIPPVNLHYPSRLQLLWKFSLITNHISFIAGRKNFLRSLIWILYICSPAFGEISHFWLFQK